jgi:hypothetical protein
MALVAIGLVALAITAVVIVDSPGSSRGASQPKVAGAATVQRRDLVATDTESGTLGYANPQTVYDRLSGTITWLPAVGQQVSAGQALFKVDDAPVTLFDGPTPAYRDLSPEDSDGPDILELNRNLVALGFGDGQITVNNTWQAGTTDALERWQGSLGETETGTITLGQVVFLPGTQLITSVSTVLGSDGQASSASGSGSGSGNSTSYDPPASHPEFVELTKPAADGPTGPTGPAGPTGPSGNHPSGKKGKHESTALAQLKALTALLEAELAEMRAKPGGGASGGGGGSKSPSGGGGGAGGGAGGGGSGGGESGSGSGSGSGGATAQAVLQTTSTQEVVTVDLDATKQTEAVVGEPVTVELPDGSTVNGKITQVSPVAQSSSNSDNGSGGGSGGGNGNGNGSSSPSAVIPVTITLTGHPSGAKGLDQAAVSVNFVQQKANNVLSVPVTALIATQGGAYAVQEADAPHSLIPVTPGLFAAGFVQISGSGIYPGLQVTDSQG